MTEHEKIKQKLDPFVDNELNEQERKLVEAHLQQCPGCQHEIAVLTKLHHLTKEAVPKPDADYAEHLAGQVWLKIRKQARARAKARFFWIPRLAPILAGAATLILVAVIGIKFLTTTSSQKKIKASTGLPSMAEAIDEDKKLADRIETGKGEVLPPSVTRAKKSEKKEPAQMQAKKAITIEKTDLTEKREELTTAKPVEPVVTAERPVYTRNAVTSIELEKIDRYSVRVQIPTAHIYEKKALESGDRYPKSIELPEPEYPKVAKEQRLSGKVVIDVLVDTNGLVLDTKILKSSNHSILDSAAFKAAMESKFIPAKQRDRIVRVWQPITYEFLIPEAQKELQIAGKGRGEEEFAEAEILTEQLKPESTRIESITTRLATPAQRAELAEKGEITQFFVVGAEPEPIEIAKPKYPKSAQEKKLEGEVVIKVIVGLNGEVEFAEVLKSSGYGILDTAALGAAQKSKFKSVIEKGKKIRALTTIPFKFTVPEK